MTCIVAHKDGWMVSDRRVSFGTYIGPYDVTKIVKHDWHNMLIGVAGVGAFVKSVSTKTKDCASVNDVKQVLSDMCLEWKARQEDICLLVVTKGVITEFDPSGGMFDISSNYDYWAIGSGSMAAVGYLDGLKKCGVKITPDIGIETIQYVSRLNVGVGDGTQMEFLT